MMLALLLLFTFTLTGYLVGNRFALKLSERRRYFEECSILIDHLIGDFRFKQTSICDILEQYDCKSDALKRNLEEFCSYAKGQIGELSLTTNILNESEIKCIIELFSALGRYDLDTQLIILGNFKEKISSFYNSANEQEKKMSGVYRKIGALCGLMIGILTV